jgi:hypothetical protein
MENNVRLNKNGIMSRKRGVQSISCREGKLWITASGQSGDILLCEGDSCETRGFRDICVQAFEDSALTVTTKKIIKGDADRHGRRLLDRFFRMDGWSFSGRLAQSPQTTIGASPKALGGKRGRAKLSSEPLAPVSPQR